MNEKNRSQHLLMDFIMNRKWRLLRHLIFISLLAITIYPDVDPALMAEINIPNPEYVLLAVKKSLVIVFIAALVIVYFNIWVMVPKLLFRERYLYYMLCSLAVALLFYFTQTLTMRYYIRGYEKYFPETIFTFKGFLDVVLIPFIFLAATSGIKIFKKWVADTQRMAELKEASIRDELNTLKTQINPHFLFNTLNNLNTLISKNQPKASAVVVGLSDVLRYQLYETNADKVLLKKDIEILGQLLELEKIRRDDFQFSLQTEGNISGLMVPPFIFTNFVENAIKHSADNSSFSFISILFQARDGELLFFCKNSKPIYSALKSSGGLGLFNIKRRLELIYEKRYALQIQPAEKEYTVELKIPV